MEFYVVSRLELLQIKQLQSLLNISPGTGISAFCLTVHLEIQQLCWPQFSQLIDKKLPTAAFKHPVPRHSAQKQYSVSATVLAILQ